jgi:hypothetical protein
MHINEQNPRTLRRQLQSQFAHVEMWFGSPEAPAGSLQKHCSPREISEFRDIYCVAGHQPVSRSELQAPFNCHDLTDVSVELTAEKVPGKVKTNETFKVTVRLHNPSDTWLTSRGDHPVFISYQWRDSQGNLLAEEGWRNPLVPALGPGRSAEYQVRIVSPSSTGCYRLMISILQEHRFWISTESNESENSFIIDIE